MLLQQELVHTVLAHLMTIKIYADQLSTKEVHLTHAYKLDVFGVIVLQQAILPVTLTNQLIALERLEIKNFRRNEQKT